MKNKKTVKQKNSLFEKISTLSFLTLIPFVIFLIYVLTSVFRETNDEVELPKIMIKDIKNVRIAIDEYYRATGTFPNLELVNTDEKLEQIFFEQDGERIYFKDFLKENTMPSTPAYKKLSKTNKVTIVTSFRKPTNDGGWNYNIETGEIHVNLPENFFGQGIDWKSY